MYISNTETGMSTIVYIKIVNSDGLQLKLTKTYMFWIHVQQKHNDWLTYCEAVIIMYVLQPHCVTEIHFLLQML